MHLHGRLIALAAAVVLAGAGALAASSGGTKAPTLRTTVYFLTDGGSAPIGVRRSIRRKSPYARGALAALLAGPSRREAQAAITTAIPRGTAVRGFEIQGSTIQGSTQAVVDLAGLPPVEDADAVVKARVITQVARTLIGLSGIERVRLRAGGRPWGLWDQRGRIVDIAYGYPQLLGLAICTSRQGTETVLAECFAALP